MSSKEKLMGVLLAPHVSEKSALAAEKANQFVFRVRKDATKPDIKAAVELMFEVKVDTAMPSRSSAMSRDSASTRSKLMLVVLKTRRARSPLTTVPGTWVRMPLSNRSRSRPTCRASAPA